MLPMYKRGDEILKYKLMLKQHYETGVNYLCITKTNDYLKYNGSGVRWKNLIKKYPSDILTTLIYTSDDIVEFDKICVLYSKFFSVAKNEFFANIIDESGYIGNQGNLPDYMKSCSAKQLKEFIIKGNKTRIKTCQTRYGFDDTMHIAREKGREKLRELDLNSFMDLPEVKEKMKESYKKNSLEKHGVDHPMKVESLSTEIKIKRENTLLNKYGVKYPLQLPNKGKEAAVKRNNTMLERYGCTNPSQIPGRMKETAKKISETKRNAPELLCPHCLHTSRSKSNMTRYHFDNCKKKELY